MSNQSKENKGYPMEGSLFRWEHIKTMKFTIKSKKTELTDSRERDSKDREDKGNTSKEKPKFGQKNL